MRLWVTALSPGWLIRARKWWGIQFIHKFWAFSFRMIQCFIDPLQRCNKSITAHPKTKQHVSECVDFTSSQIARGCTWIKICKILQQKRKGRKGKKTGSGLTDKCKPTRVLLNWLFESYTFRGQPYRFLSKWFLKYSGMPSESTAPVWLLYRSPE